MSPLLGRSLLLDVIVRQERRKGLAHYLQERLFGALGEL